jgi:16S rRNA processing protein RimM
MISREKCILLGTFVRTHGVHGSLLLRAISPEIQKIKGPGSVFVETDGLLVPFFIMSVREKSQDEYIVDLDDINTVGLAERLSGHKVYIQISNLPAKKSRSIHKDITGYMVTDENSGFKGAAVDIMEAGANILLRISKDGHEYLIPYHEDIILNIDHRKKTITVSAPDGLFDL